MKLKIAAGLALLSIGFWAGCQSPARTTHTTLDGLGRSVDLAEREYVEGVLAKRYRTNGYPEVQRSYQLFQFAYSNAVWIAARSTNAVGIPAEVRSKADDTLNRIKSAQATP